MAAFGIVAVIYIIWTVALVYGSDKLPGTTQAGTFGDAYGVINALFSAMAFAAVVVTLVMTKRQLRMQAEELAAQHRSEGRRAVQDQFFQMLESWQKVAEQVVCTRNVFDDEETLHGHAALAEAGRTIAMKVRSKAVGPSENDLEFRRKLIAKMIDGFVDDRRIELGHYFRLLYHIVRFVVSTSESLMSESEKQDLLRVLRAHFSDPEFVLIFYNGIHPNGRAFDKLIDDYDLVQNINPRNIGQPIDLDFYPKTKERWARDGKTVSR